MGSDPLTSDFTQKRGLTPLGSTFLWAPVVLYICFIFWLSSAPRPVPAFLRWRGADKLFHTVEYAPLGALLSRALARSQKQRRWRQVQTRGFLAAVTVGVLDEWVQHFTHLRCSSLWDALFDAGGAALGQLLYWIRKRRHP